jgi:hypothetical protein
MCPSTLQKHDLQNLHYKFFCQHKTLWRFKVTREKKRTHEQLHLNVRKKTKNLGNLQYKAKTTMETYVKMNKQVTKNQQNVQWNQEHIFLNQEKHANAKKKKLGNRA